MDSLVSRIDDHRHLELRFERQGDRHSHVIFLVEAGRARRAVQSIEGDNQAAWPPSPPLQQLSMESRASGEVGLLVGMAGRSHWSLSVESLAGGEFRFDAAVRLAEDVDSDESRWLGSTYQCLEPHVIELEPIEGLLVSDEANVFQAMPKTNQGQQQRWTYVIRVAG